MAELAVVVRVADTLPTNTVARPTANETIGCATLLLVGDAPTSLPLEARLAVTHSAATHTPVLPSAHLPVGTRAFGVVTLAEGTGVAR